MTPNEVAGLSRGQERLSAALSVVAFPEDIAQVLGIEDMSEMDEEFWTAQVRAARHRFYWMCLHSLNWVLSEEIQDLEEEQAAVVASAAAKFLAIPGFNYKQVRSWYKNFGQFAVDKAFKLRREKRQLAGSCIRLLVIYNKGAKFVNFDSSGQPVAVDEADAFKFEVGSISETSKAYLAEMAKHFEYLLSYENVKQIKLLVGRR